MDFATVESVRIKVLKMDAAAQVPRYAHTGPYGDLAADLYALGATTLAAGETAPVATGIALEFPSTHGALVEDRSGLAMRGITTLAGVIDPGYRGEIRVVMTNLERSPARYQTRRQNRATSHRSPHRSNVRRSYRAGRCTPRRKGLREHRRLATSRRMLLLDKRGGKE